MQHQHDSQRTRWTKSARASALALIGATVFVSACRVTPPVANPEAPTSPPNAQAPAQADEELSAEEIRQRRHFRSHATAERVLAAPSQVLEIPWAPIRRFLDYSERTDFFERVRDWFYFDDARTTGWNPKASVGGEFSSGAGLGVFDHDVFDLGHEAELSGLVASEGSFEVVASYAVPRDARGATFGRFETRIARNADVDVFAAPDGQGGAVTGVDTGRSDESSYGFRSWTSALEVGRELSPTTSVSGRIGAELARSFSAEDPAVTGLSGFGQEILIVDSGLTGAFDRRDDPVRPSSGWFVEGGVGAAVSPDEDPAGERYAFTSYSSRFEFYQPLFAPHRVLALRQSLERVDPLGDGQVPFQRLPILDRNHGLRSLGRNRFRDQGALVTNVEYRFPIWQTWDAFLLFDLGQTFEDYADITARDLEYAGGGGIRFMSEDKLLFLLQVGAGAEGTEVVFQLGQGF